MSLIRLTTKGETVIADTLDEWGNKIISNTVTEYGTRVYLEPMRCDDTLIVSDETCLFNISTLLSDVTTILDTLESFTIVKVITNSFTGLVDSITRGNARILPLETVNVNDVIEKGVVRRSFDEAMSITDTIIVTPIKSCIEAIGVTDTLGAFSISKLISNATSIIDSRVSSMNKTPIEEEVSTNDSISKTPIKVTAEVVSTDDNIVKDITHIESESVIINDSITRFISRIFTEVYSISDSISNAIVVVRTFAESITTTDVISNVRKFFYEKRSKITNKLLQSNVVNKLLRSKVEGIKNSEAEQYED